MKIPQELLDQYGIKRTEIVFTNPKRVILRYHGGKDEVYENVSEMDVEDGPLSVPIGASIHVYYETDEGERAMYTAAENIIEVIVADR